MFLVTLVTTIIISALSLAGLRWFFPALEAQLLRSDVLAIVIILFTAFLIEALIMTLLAWWRQRQQTKNIELLQQRVTREREFVSLAAHQLRTPLSALKWSLDLLRRGEVEQTEQPDFVQKIESSNNQLIGLVNDLLNVSRIDEGRMNFARSSFDSSEKTREVIELVQKSYADKKLKIKLELSSTIATVTTDPEKLSMVLMNVIDNACKYTPSGGTILVKLTSDRKRTVWTITDSGVGIPRAQQARLFEKFFRADNVVKAQISGTGLGLYLARQIITHEHGTLQLSSEEGKGTIATITLPHAA